MSIESLKRAIKLIGGQTATARILSRPERTMAQANVWKWLNSPNPDSMPPAEYCPAIERATNGQVRCEDLRPDVDWAVLRCTCPPEQRVTEPIQSLSDASFARHLGEVADQQKDAA